LAGAIGRATKNRLLSKEEKRSLNKFRANTRNPYLHNNIKKLTSEVVGRVNILDVLTGEIEVKVVSAKDDPLIQSDAKDFVDKELVFIVFGYTNTIVKMLWSKIEHLQNEPK
jgi:hypothetical protein